MSAGGQMWDRILADGLIPIWEADAELLAALGGWHGYAAGSQRPIRIPSFEWFLIFDQFVESLNLIGLQLDYWARGADEAAVIERRLRALTHSEIRTTIAGVNCGLTYRDSRNHEYRSDPGVVHRSLDFDLSPVRERYLTT